MQIKWHEVKGRVHLGLNSKIGEVQHKLETTQLPVRGEMGAKLQAAEPRNGLVERKRGREGQREHSHVAVGERMGRSEPKKFGGGSLSC